MVPLLRLASNSPRRKQLLALTGIPFTVKPVDIDESVLPGELPSDYVLRLARTKARAAGLTGICAGQELLDEIILASDTTVADGSQILGKPSGVENAREMLRSLCGREHFVYTAISVADPASGQMVSDLCTTKVWMRAYLDEEIEAYIASGDPFDKAGAYAIQNASFHPVERIEGCYACVMGLPVCHVIRALKVFGLEPVSTVSNACPEYLEMGMPCPVYRHVLPGSRNYTTAQQSQD